MEGARMSTARVYVGLTISFALLAAFSACKPSDSAPAPAPTTKTVYEMRGVIERLGTASAPRQLRIRHESTPDMESMAMPFSIDEGVPLTGLAVGDKVAFTFEIDSATQVEHVTKLSKLPADTVLKIPGASSTPASATASAPATTMKGMPGM
jgi:Cu/Ag efflux protein CusF